MQKNETDDNPTINRRKAGIYAPVKFISVVDDDVDEIPTVVDQLLEYNRKIVAMEKAAQSSGQGSPKDLPRLRGRPKIGSKDDKKTSTKNDASASKSETKSEKKTGKRSLRSNATEEVGKVKLRSSLKLSSDTANKKLSPGKKILKKAKGVVVAKKGKKNTAEESILRNGKRKRKAQSPVFPEKDTLKKKVKKITDDSSSSACSTPILDISKNEDLDNEFSIGEKIKGKRLSVDDVTSPHSKSELEEKDSEGVIKRESEVTKVSSSLMKIRNRKKKSRSIEKTGGNIWAVDSNGSELVISDTASTNTSRRSSFNSITSENNSNSQDMKLLDQPMCSEQTILPITSNNTLIQEEKKSEQFSELVPQVKTQLVVPFSINNKPVLKTGNKIKRLNIFIDDTTDNTDSDALAIDTDTCATDDEESSFFKPRVLNTSNDSCKSDEIKDVDKVLSEENSNLTNEDVNDVDKVLPEENSNLTDEEIKDVEKILSEENSNLTNEERKNVEKILSEENSNLTDEEDIDNTISNEDDRTETTSIETNAVVESELLEVIEPPIELKTQNEPKNTAEAQPCDSKDNKIDNEISSDSCDEKNVKIPSDSSSTKENVTDKHMETSVNNAQGVEKINDDSMSDQVPINISSTEYDSILIKQDESKKIISNEKPEEESLNEIVNESNDNEKVSDNKQNIVTHEVVPSEKLKEVMDDKLGEDTVKPTDLVQCDKDEREKRSEELNIIENTENEDEKLPDDNKPFIQETQPSEIVPIEKAKSSEIEIIEESQPSKDVEVLSVINKETFLDPETGLLQNVIKTEIEKGEKSVGTKLSLEAVLNVSIDSNVEKIKGNFISPELISSKVDENVSLYEDTDMVETPLKLDEDRNEELKLEFNENISTDICATLKEENLTVEGQKSIAQDSSVQATTELEQTAEHCSVENTVPNSERKDQNISEMKNELKRGAVMGVDELMNRVKDTSCIVETQKKMDFLNGLKLQSTEPASSEEDDSHANKKAKVSFGIKETCPEKDENYTGTLKVTLTRKRDCEKKVCPAENEENEELEYKICPKRVHKLNRNFPLTPMILLHSECPQTPPHLSFYKTDEEHQDYSYRVLTYVGPIEKEEPVPTQDAVAAANALVVQLANEDDANVKPTRKRIVIPEKSSSFSIHPQRLCDDVCKYCYTKFGSLDTPCHIAQLKSGQLQNHVLKTIMALGTNLTSDSCLCDACYRRVIRMPQDKSEPCPVKKKKKRAKENLPCYVPECEASGIHNVTKKVFHKIKRALRNKLSIEPERLTSATHFNLCADHYHWVLVALRCFVCEKRQSKQMSEPRAERVLLKAQLESEGIRVQMVDQSSYICKMCKYFCSLLLKKNHMTPSAKDFFDSYKITLLNKNKSSEEKESDETSETTGISAAAEPSAEKEKVEEEEPKKVLPVKKEEPIVIESETLPEQQMPLKLPGEDDIVLHTDLDINKPAKSSSTTLERFNTTIQFDIETKKLYQSLLRPYGNQSSFLRHLVILEKYFREGNLVLKEDASSKAQRYINTVNNRIQACNGTVYNPVRNSTAVSSESTPQTSLVNITSKVESINVNVTPVSSSPVTQLTITPEVSVLAGFAPNRNNNTPPLQQPRRFPPIKPAPPIKFVKTKNTKPPLPGLNPIEKPVEIISSPEISLYNIPAEANGTNFRGMRGSPALEITPDVSISKTFVPKQKSISSSIPISQTHISPNTSQSNVVFLLPPSSTPIVSFGQQVPFDNRRQSFSNSKVSNPNPGVSISNTSPATPQFFISNVRSLAPGPMQTSNVPIKPKKATPPAAAGKKEGVVIARIPYNKGFERSVTLPSTGPVPNYMLFPRGPRSTSPNITTSIIPPVSLMSGSQSRSLSGSQVANRNDKNVIRALLNARPNLSTSFQGNKSEP